MSFKSAFTFTLGNEGGYTNDPEDSGGPTNWGITIGDLSRFLGRPAKISEVKNMTKATAEIIYEKWYWSPLGLDKMTNPGMATALFDIGVVRGIGVPPKYAQEILNAHGAKLVVDGHLGPKSYAALNSIDPKVFIDAFAARVEEGFRAIVRQRPSQKVFLKGWVNRARRLRTLA